MTLPILRFDDRLRARFLPAFLPSSLLSLCLLSPANAQAPAAVLPSGTPLVIRITNHMPMRAGLPISAELIYPVYIDNQVILPTKTVLNGTVVALRPNTKRRIRARLGGDFTPFHIPVVHFTELVLPDGVHISIDTGTSTDGAPIFRAVAPPAAKGGFFRQEFDMGLAVARSDVALFTAPGKADRLKQFAYNRLPYHPELIEKDTAWTTEVTQPISLPSQPLSSLLPAAVPPSGKRHFWEEAEPVVTPPDTNPGRWTIQAYLDQPLSSETSKMGEPIKATVASPILNPDGTVAIPQGATLVGTVSKAQPARHFGRTGILSFSFRQLTLPGGEPQNVQTTLTGADSAAGLALNSEGQVKSKPQDKLSLPIILAVLASSSLDHDKDGAASSSTGRDAASGAAGLGLVGTIIGLAGASPNAVAGIGYYGAALAFYDRWIARGKTISFPRDTRIVVQTIARHSAPLHADPSGPRDAPRPRNR